jgi:hypothetical protein
MTKAQIITPITSPQHIEPSSLREAGIDRQIFRLNLNNAFTKEDLLNPHKWRQIAKSQPTLKTGSVIEVLREDMAFFATMLVVGKVMDEVFLKFINFVALEDEKSNPSKESDFSIEWKGPIRKFAIIRKSDNSLRKDGLASKEEALYHIKNTL